MERLDKILHSDNLNEAYKRVFANKGASGVDGVTVNELLDYLKENKVELLESIRTRKYKPQPVRRVEIPKDNGKKRQLGIPTVVDRVIQQASAQILTPIYEKWGLHIGMLILQQTVGKVINMCATWLLSMRQSLTSG